MKHSTTVAHYLIRIERLIAAVTLNDASAAFDEMEAVLDEVKRRDLLPLSDEEAEAADELEEEIEDAMREIGYLIDAGMDDDGNEDAVMDAMEGRIILQACDAVESFRTATAG